MTVNTTELLALSPAEKLQIVELLWNDLASSPEPLPLASWIEAEGRKRLAGLQADPGAGLSHEEVWQSLADHHA